MVNKRYTYAYSEFVHGRYPSDKNYVLYLLNKMTIPEKVLLMSLNFEIIWYHIWLNTPKPHTYTLAKNRFDGAYLLDGGDRLRTMIRKSRSVETLWEIPKGRKKNKNETDIGCAIREFKEETGIEKKSYYIFQNAKHTQSYIDNSIHYVNTYYIAYTRHIFEPRIELSPSEQIDEICSIKWMNIQEIRLIDTNKYLENHIQSIFKFIKKRLRDIEER